MNRTDAVLSRDYGDKSTLGCLYIFEGSTSIFNCVMIELPRFIVPMRSNRQNINCIPGGRTYDVKKHYSPTKGRCFKVMNVTGRTDILWHIGNFATGKKVDTEGCQLPGMYFEDVNGDGELDVADSTTAMNTLLAIMPDEFKLTIL